jgi:hypothetical protein
MKPNDSNILNLMKTDLVANAEKPSQMSISSSHQVGQPDPKTNRIVPPGGTTRSDTETHRPPMEDNTIRTQIISSPHGGQLDPHTELILPPGGTTQIDPRSYPPTKWANSIQLQIISSPNVGDNFPATIYIIPPWETRQNASAANNTNI